MQDKEKAQFRTVALPLETYEKVKRIAKDEERSIARQVSVIVNKYIEQLAK